VASALGFFACAPPAPALETLFGPLREARARLRFSDTLGESQGVTVRTDAGLCVT